MSQNQIDEKSGLEGIEKSLNYKQSFIDVKGCLKFEGLRESIKRSQLLNILNESGEYRGLIDSLKTFFNEY